MKFLSKVTLISIMLFTSAVCAVTEKDSADISAIIDAFKSQDKKVIATLISYPLNRETPIPSIKNEAELIEQFDQIFDKELIDVIASSDRDNDWSQVGWRGIMLLSGIVWLDDNGKIKSINYQTSKEKMLKNNLIEQQKQTLHSSVSVFYEPVLEWKTTKFHIRIDDLGDYNYRYTSWDVNKKTTEKPDLVLLKGEIVFEGSGGNHHYSFTNGQYVYRCYISVLGHSRSAPGTLEVFKDERLLLSDDVIEVLKN